jgi:hypothetical protein
MQIITQCKCDEQAWHDNVTEAVMCQLTSALRRFKTYPSMVYPFEASKCIDLGHNILIGASSPLATVTIYITVRQLLSRGANKLPLTTFDPNTGLLPNTHQMS